jgi:hypothetical protein
METNADPEPWDLPCGVQVDPIPTHHHLLRRLIDDDNHITWEGDQPIPHPTAGNSLQFDTDGMSTTWTEHIERDGLSVDAILAGKHDYTLVAEVSVQKIRALPMDVVHDPLDVAIDDSLTRCGHTLVKWHESTFAQGSNKPDKFQRPALKYKLARSFQIIHGKVTTPKPPGQ